MAAGLRAVLEAASLIDVVLEVRDARLPGATAVAHLHQRLRSKPTFILLNRQDLADPTLTRAWLGALAQSQLQAFSGIGTRADSLRQLRHALLSAQTRRSRVRIAVVGAPNTGKSSVINALARRKTALVQDKPGVTKQVRWIPLDGKAEVLDTPGVLEPRIRSKGMAWQLAMCGILPESAFDLEEVVAQFSDWLAAHRPAKSAAANLEIFGREHGILRRGGEPDPGNAARAFIKYFRAGKFGRITFENPKAV